MTAPARSGETTERSRAAPAGRRLAAVLLATSAMVSPALAQDEAPKWGPSLDLEGALGTERWRGEVDAFWPVWQDGRAMVFADLRGKLFEDDISEGNFGLGYRRMTEGGWNLGGYGYFDLRSSENDNTFTQITVGAEALSVDWDLRANGYIPLDDPEPVPGASTAELQGASLVVRAGREVPLWGLDAEVGWRVPVFAAEDDSQLRVYAGGFYFDSDDVDDAVAGPRLRLEYRLHDLDWLGQGSRLTLSASGQHDDERDAQGTVGLRLRIPLQTFIGAEEPGRPLTPIERRMTDPVVRDVDIVTVAAETVEPAVDAATGTKLDTVVFVDGGGSLADALAAAGTGGLVIAQGDAGDLAGNVTVQAGQTLLGGGGRLQVRGAGSGAPATFTAPGSRPRVTHADNAPVISIGGDNVTVAGLDIAGAGQGSGLSINHGIHTSAAVANVALIGNTIDGMGGAGAAFSGNVDTLTLTGNTISNTAAMGVLVSDIPNQSRNVTLTGNTISSTRIAGVVFSGDVDTATLAGNAIDGTTGDGMSFRSAANNVTLASNTISGTGSEGVIFSVADHVTLANNMINGTGSRGVSFSTATNVKLTGNAISDTAFRGVFFGTADTVTLTGNTISDAGAQGMNLGEAVNVTLTGNAISNTVDAGVRFGLAGTVTVAGNTISGAGSDGIEIRAALDTTLSDNMISGTASSGVNIREALNMTLSGNTISNAGGDGVSFGDAASTLPITIDTVTLTGNTISDTLGSALDFENDATNVTLTGNMISGTGDAGVDFDTSATNVTLTGNTISTTGFQGVDFRLAANVALTGNTISGTGDDGVFIFDGANVTLSGNTISDTATGVRFTNAQTVTLADNTLSRTGNGGSGFSFLDAVDVTVTGNTISDTDGNGMVFNTASAVRLTDNVISGATDDGVRFGTADAVTLRGNTISDTDTGVFFFSANNVILSGNTISAISFGEGVSFREATNVILGGNTISGTGSSGVSIGRAGVAGLVVDNVTLTDNTISDTAGNALNFGIAATNVRIDDNTFAGQIGTVGSPGGNLASLNGGSFSGSGNIDDTTAVVGAFCAEAGVAADYTGPGFSFTDSRVCGDGP